MPQQLGANKRRDKRADLQLAVEVAAAKRLLGVMLFVSVTWLQVMAAQTQTQYVKRHGVEKDLHKNCLGFEDYPYEQREKILLIPASDSMYCGSDL